MGQSLKGRLMHNGQSILMRVNGVQYIGVWRRGTYFGLEFRSFRLFVRYKEFLPDGGCDWIGDFRSCREAQEYLEGTTTCTPGSDDPGVCAVEPPRADGDGSPYN